MSMSWQRFPGKASFNFDVERRHHCSKWTPPKTLVAFSEETAHSRTELIDLARGLATCLHTLAVANEQRWMNSPLTSLPRQLDGSADCANLVCLGTFVEEIGRRARVRLFSFLLHPQTLEEGVICTGALIGASWHV